jgi:hypothetical protein
MRGRRSAKGEEGGWRGKRETHLGDPATVAGWKRFGCHLRTKGNVSTTKEAKRREEGRNNTLASYT